MNRNRKGNIEVICGPMFSGKTEELIRRLVRGQIAKKNVSIFKNAVDNRYSDEYVVSHNKNKIKCQSIKEAEEIFNYSDEIDGVGLSLVQRNPFEPLTTD